MLPSICICKLDFQLENCLLNGASPRGAHDSATNMAARQPASSESCRFEHFIFHSLCLFKLVSPKSKGLY